MDWTVVGAAVPGSEQAVAAIDRGRPSGLQGSDPAFDTAKFTAWSETVLHRAMAAWRTGNPEPLHPVMHDQVWNDYAQWLLLVRAVALLRTMMGGAQATPTFLGAADGGGYHCALVEYAVHGGVTELTAGGEGWRERWLFQRPDTYRTGPSGAVAVCSVCGAPAEPEETGQCRYCHADITTRTSGWLVTRTSTTLHGAGPFHIRFGGGDSPGSTGSTGSSPLLQPPRAGITQPPRSGP